MRMENQDMPPSATNDNSIFVGAFRSVSALVLREMGTLLIVTEN